MVKVKEVDKRSKRTPFGKPFMTVEALPLSVLTLASVRVRWHAERL